MRKKFYSNLIKEETLLSNENLLFRTHHQLQTYYEQNCIANNIKNFHSMVVIFNQRSLNVQYSLVISSRSIPRICFSVSLITSYFSINAAVSSFQPKSHMQSMSGHFS